MDLPPGRRQFRLVSLVWLLCAGAIVLSFAKILHCGPWTTALLLGLTVAMWWRVAELRHEPPRRRDEGSAALREEIERWKQGRN